MVIQSYGTTDNNEGLSSRGRSTEEQNTAQCTPTNKCSETPASFLLTESFRSQPRPTQPERLRVNLTLDFFSPYSFAFCLEFKSLLCVSEILHNFCMQNFTAAFEASPNFQS